MIYKQGGLKKPSKSFIKFSQDNQNQIFIVKRAQKSLEVKRLLKDFVEGNYNEDIEKIQNTVIEEMEADRVSFGSHRTQTTNIYSSSIH